MYNGFLSGERGRNMTTCNAIVFNSKIYMQEKHDKFNNMIKKIACNLGKIEKCNDYYVANYEDDEVKIYYCHYIDGEYLYSFIYNDTYIYQCLNYTYSCNSNSEIMINSYKKLCDLCNKIEEKDNTVKIHTLKIK